MNRIDPRSRAAADREGAIRGGEDDGIALHVLHDAPGELHRESLLIARSDVGREFRGHHFFWGRIRFLHEEPTEHAAHFKLPRIDLLPIKGEQASVLLLLKKLHGLVGEAGGDQDLGEDLVDLLSEGQIEGTIGNDDPAEGRIRIRCEGVLVGSERRVACTDATGRVVLEDGNHCAFPGGAAVRRHEVDDQTECGLGIHQVVVGERLAVVQFADFKEVAIKDGTLMAVLSVPKLILLLERDNQGLGEDLRGLLRIVLTEPLRNGRVVARRMLEGLEREPASQRWTQSASISEFLDNG